ncbi:MAG: serine hydroxymethyltransferase [Lentisphaerae bacterium]|nr:serine hydroxymethyltransferase [Lentisphaerota bacterium]
MGSPLSSEDPEVSSAIRDEEHRLSNTINLIASENYASRAVREAEGSVMTNKYAEGYPGHRWYNGCESVDAVERLAIDRAKGLFGADHVNVQSHSGSSANMAVYFSCLEPGATILAMSLAHGGHLTHGHNLNFSGRLFRIKTYGVSRDDERLDIDEVAGAAREHKPALIVVGASAYPREIEFAAFAEVARDVGALLMVDMAHIAGLVAAGCHPDPIACSDYVSTTTHKTLRGPRSGMVFCRKEHAAAIDRNVFPGLQGGPFMHTIAAKAVCLREASTPEFTEYAQAIVRNAKAMADSLLACGFRLVSGGTDNHLMLVDLGGTGINGEQAACLLEQAGLILNKNVIPFEKGSARVPSGIRIGTPAVTTRGMQETEMRVIGTWIAEILQNPSDDARIARVRGEVNELALAFPVP